MKTLNKFIGLLYILAVFSTNAIASKGTAVTIQNVDVLTGSRAPTNFLLNPSLENGTVNWSHVTVTPTSDTTNYHNGVKSGLMTFSSNSGEVYQDVTPTVQMTGAGMESGAWVKTTMTTVQVCAREAGADILCKPVPSTGTWQYVPVSFGGPSSGSIGVSVGTTGSSTGTFNYDDLYTGFATNTSMLSQAQFIGSSTWNVGTNSWTISTGSTSFQSFPANASIGSPTLTGLCTAPATKLPQCIIPSAAPGTYKVTLIGNIQSAGSNHPLYTTITDGTNTSGDTGSVTSASSVGTNGNTVGYFNYTTTQTNLTFQPQARVATGTGNILLGSTSIANETIVLAVEFIPSQQQAGYRPDQTPALYSGTINCSGNPTSTGSSPTDFSGGSGCTLTSNLSINMGTPTIGSTNTGVNFTPPKLGAYFIIANASFSTNSSSSHTAPINLTDGSGNILGGGNYLAATSGSRLPMTLFGALNVSATGSQTVKFMNGGITTDTITAYAANGGFNFLIVDASALSSLPYLMGSISNNTTSTWRHFAFYFAGNTALSATCSSSPCTVSQVDNAVSSVTRQSTGQYTVNFTSGYCSARPFCTFTPIGIASEVEVVGSGQSSWSSTLMTLETLTDVNASTDGGAAFQCDCAR